MQIKGSKVIITGGSSGIGKATAELFIEKGAQVLITGRNEKKLLDVAKEIGAMATVLKGKVDAIILTGGIAYSKRMVNLIKERIDHMASVVVYAGEDELLALAEAALRVLTGEEDALKYE